MECQVIVRVVKMPKTGATNYNAQLDKNHAIKGLVVYRANGRFAPQLRHRVCFKVIGEVYNPKRHQAPLCQLSLA